MLAAASWGMDSPVVWILKATSNLGGGTLTLKSVVTVNLETGYPTVEGARQVLRTELEQCRSRKVTAVIVIHGYGSSGVGGALRQGIRKSLIKRRQEGSLRAVVFGEKWSIFDPATRSLLEECPELSNDRDLFNCNPGISIILL
jgi:ribosomal protein S9